jgi:hypothetical protein
VTRGAVRVATVAGFVVALATPAPAAPPAPHHFALQGVARDAQEASIPAGDVAVRIHADSLGGAPLFDSGSEFAGAIEQGIVDLVVGRGTPLLLDPEGSYFLELDVAGVEVIGNAAGGRWRFQPGGGSSARPDLESRLDALESAMGLSHAPPVTARPDAALSLPGARTLAFSSTHPYLGLGRTEASGGSYTVTANLVTQPVGRRGSGGVRVDLGPFYLFAPTPAPVIRFVRDVPGDQGRSVRVRWRNDLRERPYQAADPLPRITSYTLYRRVEAGQAPTAPEESGDPALAALRPGEWDVLTTVPATLDTTYQTVVPTLCDSTTAGVCWSVFLVRAITDRPGLFHDSALDSGYAVDNLAPGVPQGLGLLPVAEGTRLQWQPSPEPDFQYFRVYRSLDPEFVPGLATFVQATAATTWTDPAAGGFTYRLTAVDANGNESLPASVTVTTGAPEVLPERLDFVSVAPNPFRGRLTFVVAVPAAAGPVELSVYDLAGRRIRTLTRGALAPGRHTFLWDGRTDGGRRLAAGVYVSRLSGAARSVTRRATLVP